jgi:hypothetical protein
MNTDQFPRPANFPYTDVFYFDGSVAMMLGVYKDSKEKSVGLRWMVGESEIGYPNARGNPMWMVAPDKLGLYMLEGILKNIEQEYSSICNLNEFMHALNHIRNQCK